MGIRAAPWPNERTMTTKDKIQKLLAVASGYGIEILLPGH